MFIKKAFTITIGNNNALLVLHHDKSTKNKILITDLTAETKTQIIKILKQDSSAPIYILLDNAEQNYNKKSYPSVNIFDLRQIIKRHIKQEFTNIDDKVESNLYNYITRKSQKSKKWECLYVSTTYFDGLQEWIDFLVKEAPNQIVGIYMLPIETINLVKKIHLSNKVGKEIKPTKKDSNAPEKITLLIIENKVGGFRQIIFSDERIIFTRLTQYDYEHENFIVNFEQDIFRTNEYLKRILPNLKLGDMEIINILPEKILDKINTIKNREINFTNYTPKEVANKIGHTGLLSKNSQFSDVLIANIFVNSKKILRSETDKIKLLNLFKKILRSTAVLNMLSLIFIILYAIFIQIEGSINSTEIKKLTKSKVIAENNLQKIKGEVVGVETGNQSINIDEIIEFGKFDELMENNKTSPVELFNKLNLGSEKEVSISSFDFGNEYLLDEKKEIFTAKIDGKITNETGDVENLFKIYDNVILKATEQFKEYQVVSSELPKNIDFSKKYYEVDFNLTITNK